MTHVLMVTSGQKPGFRWPLDLTLVSSLGLHGPTRGFSQSSTMEQGATTPPAGQLCGQTLLHLPSQDPTARRWLLQHLPPLTSPLLGPTRPCRGSRDHAGASTLATEVPAVGWEMGVGGESPLSWFSSAGSPTARHYWVSLMGQFLQWRSMATGLQRGDTAAGGMQATPLL